MNERASSSWQNALLAAAVHAVAPSPTGGIRLRSNAGPVREAWLQAFHALLVSQTPVRRMPASIADSRLLGGLDLAATLQAGRPVAEQGLLAETNGGFLFLAMAERIEPATAAKLAAVLDRGVVTTERDGLAILSPARFGLVALDESLGDEQPPRALLERLGLIVDIRDLSHRDIQTGVFDNRHIEAARTLLPSVFVNDEILTALCGASEALGVLSVRATLYAVQVTRALAALDGRIVVSDEDAATAAILVLAPRATQIPQSETQETPASEEEINEADAPPPPPPSENQSEQNAPSDTTQPALDDVVLDAALANIPPNILAALNNAANNALARTPGKAGQFQKQATRGRVIGSRPGNIKGNTRLDVIATLRTAAPWQKLRRQRASTSSRIFVRREDIRISHYRQRSQTSTIFVVDASGSSALQRLAEAKGAVRLLLADCYVRRDEVALIAFRGTSAEILLPPTRSLVRAQRALAALPGGGGTPIALGIEAAANLAEAVARSGRTVSIVFMTDGRANVCRNGQGGRAEAQNEARIAAQTFRTMRLNSIFIDTSPKPQLLAAELSELMGARYVPLPQADAKRVAQAVSNLQKSSESNQAIRGAA